jgi:hypothetical protein
MKQADKGKQMNLDKLAKMIVKGFEETASKRDIAELDKRLAIVEAKLDRALYTSISSLEGRVKRLEQKVGIK